MNMNFASGVPFRTFRNTLAISLVLMGAVAGGCATSKPVAAEKPMPRGWTDLSQEMVIENIYVAGQPEPAALVAYKNAGGRVLVNFRSEGEMSRSVGYDEAALAESLGLEYVHIPIGRDAEGNPTYGREAVDRFADVYQAHLASGSATPLLTHCGSGGRCKVMWASYLVSERGVPVEEAIAQMEAYGMDPTWSSVELMRKTYGP